MASAKKKPSGEPKMVRLSPVLHRRLKVYAAREERPLVEVVDEAIELFLRARGA